MRKKLKNMDMLELRDLCRDRGIPFRDARSAEELRERLSSKKPKE